MSEDENCLLSAIMITPSIIFKTKINEEYFFDTDNRELFRAMKTCSSSGAAIDYVSVCEANPRLDKTYAVKIRDTMPSSANWKHYEGKIIDAYRRRKLRDVGLMLIDKNEAGDTTETIEQAEKMLLDLSAGNTDAEITKLGSLIVPALGFIEERYKAKGKLPGISTGMTDLDGMIGGLQASRYYVIGARPSDGKSALAVNMMANIGIREKVPVGFISAESSNNEIVIRLFSSEGRINGQRISSGFLAPSDFRSLQDAGTKMYDAPVYLYDAPNVRFPEMKSVARQMVASYHVGVIFLDYLQIVQWEDQDLAKHEQVAAISMALKTLARELKIPIVALSQLKRDSEGREPEMADLDYSKQIEQDADAIILIYHPKPVEPKEGKKPPEPKQSMLLVKKNRDGPKGAVFVKFEREFVRFYELEKRRE